MGGPGPEVVEDTVLPEEMPSLAAVAADTAGFRGTEVLGDDKITPPDWRACETSHHKIINSKYKCIAKSYLTNQRSI